MLYEDEAELFLDFEYDGDGAKERDRSLEIVDDEGWEW